MLIRSIFASFLLLANAAIAEERVPCAPHTAMVAALMGPQYSEYPLFEGTLSSPNKTVVNVTVFANPTTGTWTMIVSPDGKVSCTILSGESFRPANINAITGRLSSLE